MMHAKMIAESDPTKEDKIPVRKTMWDPLYRQHWPKWKKDTAEIYKIDNDNHAA
jgi:hypothetical protein